MKSISYSISRLYLVLEAVLLCIGSENWLVLKKKKKLFLGSCLVLIEIG